MDDELIIGKYIFSPRTSVGAKEHLKNFNKVAKQLNKYKMERNDKWVDRSYMNRPNDLYFALQIGDVTVYAESKNYNSGYGKLIHSIEMIKRRLKHTLTYYSQKGLKYVSEKTINDF